MRRISHRKNTLGRMIVAAAALAVFLLPAFTTDARAADSGAGASESKWYFGLNVPVMFIDDSDSVEIGQVLQPGIPLPIPYKADALTEYATGYRVSGVIGREFSNGLRLDGELFFAKAEVDKLIYKGRTTTVPTPQGPMTIDIPDDHSIPVSGSASQLGVMVNLWYDFNAGSKWRPYIGGGFGLVKVDWGDVKYNRNEVAQGAANQLALLQACVTQGQPPNCTLPPQVQQGVLSQATLPPGDCAGPFRHRYGVRLSAWRGNRLPVFRQHYLSVGLPHAERQRPGVQRQERHGFNGHGDDRNAGPSLRDRDTLSVLGVAWTPSVPPGRGAGLRAHRAVAGRA